jgi:hypothetical protein
MLGYVIRDNMAVAERKMFGFVGSILRDFHFSCSAKIMSAYIFVFCAT